MRQKGDTINVFKYNLFFVDELGKTRTSKWKPKWDWVKFSLEKGLCDIRTDCC